MNIFIFVFIIQIGFVFNLNNETVASVRIKRYGHMTTEYMSRLFSFSPTFVRPNGDTNKLYYYNMISVKVLMTGVYSFTSKSKIDTYGSFHDGAVDLSNPSKSMIAYDDDSGDHEQFQINLNMQSYKKYILLFTTYHPNVTGEFTIVAEGPTSVALTPNYNFIWESTIPTIASTYSGTLSPNSPSFSRSSNNLNNYYYQAIRIRASKDGNYTFFSSSSMDTYGYFYSDSFDPFYSSKNLITSDDESDGYGQFRISVTLKSERKYILVVTTFRQNITGNFLIKVLGPALVNLSSTGPIISRHNDVLSCNSSTFSRSNWNNDTDCYYYQAIRIRASKDGNYTFFSISSMNTYVYLYKNSFDSSHPSQNLIISNDDGDTNQQFQLQTTLQSQYTYILVVTTTNEDNRGNFQIAASGLSWIFFCSIAPTKDRQLCGNCITTYPPDDDNNNNDKSSTKIIITIVVPISSVCVLIVICCCICRCRRKKMINQQLTLMGTNQTIRTRRSSLRDIQITETTTNEIDIPFTIPLARVFEPLEEEPPPPYTSVIPHSRVYDIIHK
ncbi:unnamed protein product [Adineta ricciae]|uniref:Uncharacterized protein n=1 Tax=Adineta ricciae TaxID=249248 RepID=A0A816C919_ADIRI|nr:unnamed protein product [Adineta ricciae]